MSTTMRSAWGRRAAVSALADTGIWLDPACTKVMGMCTSGNDSLSAAGGGPRSMTLALDVVLGDS